MFKKIIPFLLFALLFEITSAQTLTSEPKKTNISSNETYSWFYLRAKNDLIHLSFERKNGLLIYKGRDTKLQKVLKKYSIYEFKKTLRNAKKEDLQRTFFVVCNSNNLLNDLLKIPKSPFIDGKIISEEDKKIYEPNDYGLTATIGDNKGLQVHLDYLDYLGLPKAWYYTTGNATTIIGMSDAKINTTNKDFRKKTRVIKLSGLSKGHGSATSSIAAAQGDNSYGVPGVCYDCNIYATKYGDFKNLKNLKELSDKGVKIINCSWAGTSYYESAQKTINSMFKNQTIVVGASGNANWKQTTGKRLYYPASFKNVISVAAGMYKHEKITDNILISKKGKPYAENIRGYVGRTIGFKEHNTKNTPAIYPVSITSLNPNVDILAPSTGVFRFNKYILENRIAYDTNEHTSNATPFVTGTIGLMVSLYPCLPMDEVESILKITSTNIDHIEANKPYYGYYGAGMLNTGKVVELVYKLYTPTEISYIENQIFTRWNFKITSLSKEIIIKNQKFIENSTFNLTAKNKIVIKKNTILKPNSSGKIHLKIDSSLEKQCDLVLREGFPNNKYYFPKNKTTPSLTPN